MSFSPAVENFWDAEENESLGLGNEVKAIIVPWKRGWRSGSKTWNAAQVIPPSPPIMPDLGDSCDGATGRSRVVSGPTAATLTLPDLPQELILRIASLLDVGDLLALRRVRLSPEKLDPP